MLTLSILFRFMHNGGISSALTFLLKQMINSLIYAPDSVRHWDVLFQVALQLLDSWASLRQCASVLPPGDQHNMMSNKVNRSLTWLLPFKHLDIPLTSAVMWQATVKFNGVRYTKQLHDIGRFMSGARLHVQSCTYSHLCAEQVALYMLAGVRFVSMLKCRQDG